MRIVGGRWRGRTLAAPPGQATRPTADRVRQALFDMLLHASWGGRAAIAEVVVLDVFAGTGALGLEALSRGAARACFIENNAAALLALRSNIAACDAQTDSLVVAGDALRVAPARRQAGPVPEVAPSPAINYRGRSPVSSGRLARRRAGTGEASMLFDGEGATPASLVFLDPPYGQQLVPRALEGLAAAGWIAPGALVIAETGRDEGWSPEQPVLAERRHGAACILVFRTSDQ